MLRSHYNITYVTYNITHASLSYEQYRTPLYFAASTESTKYEALPDSYKDGAWSSLLIFNTPRQAREDTFSTMEFYSYVTGVLRVEDIPRGNQGS